MDRQNMKNSSNIEAIDLFCGAGGLTKGLEKSGIKVKVGVDVDPACEYPYFINNSGDFILKSITDIKGSELNGYYSDSAIKLLAGCAPCQTFSTYNQKATQEDDRWWLLQEFARIVKEMEPELVTMENVPGLEEQEVFQDFITGLEGQGYAVSVQVVDCSAYGLPQQRRRLVLLASKLGAIQLLKPYQFGRKKRTVRDVIGNQPAIDSGEVYEGDALHQSSQLNGLNLKRIQSSKPGGTWRDWDEELVAECHKKASGKTYPGVYGRMEWDKPAPTLTTQFFGFGNGRFGHPDQDRAISLREGAMLQSFPKGYKFVHPSQPITKTKIGRLIGNAVPVVLGELIGKTISKHLDLKSNHE